MKASELLKRTPQEILFEIDRGGRFIVYQYVVSLIVVTFRRNSPIQYLAPGESAVTKGLPWTLLTLFLGWWGIPFGFIFTPQVLYKNLKGGRDITEPFTARLRPPPPPPPLSFDRAQ